MLVAQGGQAVLLALAREIATHATVLKITNMVCILMYCSEHLRGWLHKEGNWLTCLQVLQTMVKEGYLTEEELLANQNAYIQEYN